MAVAERIKNLVDSKGITYTFISEKTGLSVNQISRSFMGKRHLLADEMISICAAAGIDLSDMSEDAPERACS